MGIYTRAAKIEAENIQLKSENARYASENARYASENARYASENARYASENARYASENARLQALVERQGLIIERYIEMIRLAQHRRFGASSEHMHCPEQLSLFNEAETVCDPVSESTESETTEVKYRRKKKVGKREELYDNIPTSQVIHELPESERICPDCGGILHACGHEVLRREVEIIPAQVRGIEHVQVVYGCRNCEKDSEADTQPMVKSSVPAPVIPNSGIASASLLAYIMSNKYALGIPLYRQEQELKRLGIPVSRQTMANWMIFAAEKRLSAFYVLLHTLFLLSGIAHADETTTQVIYEDGRTAAQKSYMWVYVTGKDEPHQMVLFEYKPTREGKHPQAFLEGFKGFLHTDAYAGYRKLEDDGVTLVGCFAHVRRKFDEALKALKKADREASDANIGLDFCNKLFALERKYDAQNLTVDERFRQRELESRPVAEAFFVWANDCLPKTAPGTKLNQAVFYALNQRPRLMNYLLEGRLEISNNRAERAIRPFAIGRNNWLFSYCAKGASASAILYSIIETAQANGLVPFLYLQFLFDTIPNIPEDRLHECLPWNTHVQMMCKIPTRDEL